MIGLARRGVEVGDSTAEEARVEQAGDSPELVKPGGVEAIRSA
jgi:hypothetical protein